MDVTSICNMALGQIGAQVTIQGIDPPLPAGSAEANACALYYSTVIKNLMRAAPWNFTRKTARATLLKAALDTTTGEPSTNPPPLPFAFEYLYPPDCIDMRFIPRICYTTSSSTSGSSTPLTTTPNVNVWPPLLAEVPADYVVAMDTPTTSSSQQIKVILTNQPNALLVYTAQINDPNLWDASFIKAAVHSLAAELVNPLARNAALLNQNVSIAASIIAEARSNDGNEGLNSQDHIPDWIQIRGTYGGAGGLGLGNNGYGYGGWSPMLFANGLQY